MMESIENTALKNAINIFNEERTEESLIVLLSILADSYVWIPCNMVMGDPDRDNLMKAIEEAGEDIESLIGEVFTNDDEIRLIPDILQNGDNFFFPVFTSPEEMGEYGNHFSRIEKHMLEAIVLAKNNERDLYGIVVNAFTDSFILDKTLYDIVEKMAGNEDGLGEVD